MIDVHKIAEIIADNYLPKGLPRDNWRIQTFEKAAQAVYDAMQKELNRICKIRTDSLYGEMATQVETIDENYQKYVTEDTPCKYCGCYHFVLRKHGPHIGKYCVACMKWQSWVSKNKESHIYVPTKLGMKATKIVIDEAPIMNDSDDCPF